MPEGLNQIVSCFECGYATLLPEHTSDEDYIICPECGHEQVVSSCVQCKVARPGTNGFTVRAVGVNQRFRKKVGGLNKSFATLIDRYNKIQESMALTKKCIDDLSGELYRKCSSELSIATVVANSVSIDGIQAFIRNPFSQIMEIDSVATGFGTPIIVTAPRFIDLDIGVPLGCSGGSNFYLVSMFTLIQYSIPGELTELVGLDIPFDIIVDGLHVSGSDLEMLDLCSHGLSQGMDSTYKFRTADVTDSMKALIYLAEHGVSIKNAIPVTGKLTLLMPDGDNEGSDDIQSKWIRDIVRNSNCHLVGGDIDELKRLVQMAGVACGAADKVLFIGENTSTPGSCQSNVMRVNNISLLDQDDFDGAEIIFIDSGFWVENINAITSELIHHLAITPTPVCVWSERPEVDLWITHFHDGELRSGSVLRYISSLCPFVSGDLDTARDRSMMFHADNPSPSYAS